ncbi:TPA: copper ABC transporter substrate-binding protein, partial [Candidatus Aciduliprofundum boonei]|nr:copper ABC transporter substrate-binding protein [Candidatus Aciduliprofundum boonei]
YNKISHNNGDGISLAYPYSGGLTHYISHNDISYNAGDGIKLVTTYKMRLNITHNNIIYNGGDGIKILPGTDDIFYLNITQNLFLNNTGYGINTSADHYIFIWENSFYFNNGNNGTYDPEHIQARDDTEYSGDYYIKWYKDGCGNYWADWTEPDRDGDGIVDDPYQLDGSSEHKDYFPLAESDIPIPEFSPMVLVVLLVIVAILIRKKS